MDKEGPLHPASEENHYFYKTENHLSSQIFTLPFLKETLRKLYTRYFITRFQILVFFKIWLQMEEVNISLHKFRFALFRLTLDALQELNMLFAQMDLVKGKMTILEAICDRV